MCACVWVGDDVHVNNAKATLRGDIGKLSLENDNEERQIKGKIRAETFAGKTQHKSTTHEATHSGKGKTLDSRSVQFSCIPIHCTGPLVSAGVKNYSRIA